MATSIGKLSKSFFLKLLVGIIILPFVFWGMGDVFRGGNQNVIASVDSEKVSTQEFVDYLRRLNLSEDQIIDFFEEKEVKGEITIVIKGIKKTNLPINKSYLKKELDELMNAGLTLSEASKYLARKNGIKKSAVYNLINI